MRPICEVFVGRVLTTSITCSVVEARDGQDAINQCQTINPDLVILDINMPRADGVRALGEIRGLKPAIRFVMLTSIFRGGRGRGMRDQGRLVFYPQGCPG